jgi:hypothetical protein
MHLGAYVRTLFLTLLIPAIAFADVDPKFAKVRDSSQPLKTTLGAFLESYVGDCSDVLEGPACKQHAEAFRQKHTGQRYYVIISEEQATMLRAGPFNPARGEFQVLVTPFFPGNGYALTQGAPKHTDSQGNPVLPLLVFKGVLPDGWDPVRFQRLFQNHELRVQLVFTPQSVWNLQGKHKKFMGVRAKIDAMLVTYARTGDPVAAYYGK